MCECAGTSVTIVHPRHRSHHRYIITRSVCVLDNSNAKMLTLPHLCQALPCCPQHKTIISESIQSPRSSLITTTEDVKRNSFMMCLAFHSLGPDVSFFNMYVKPWLFLKLWGVK